MPTFEVIRQGSLDALFREHGAFVWRVLRSHGVPDSELEDACLEVFLGIRCVSTVVAW